jgi:hypothetical protein
MHNILKSLSMAGCKPARITMAKACILLALVLTVLSPATASAQNEFITTKATSLANDIKTLQDSGVSGVELNNRIAGLLEQLVSGGVDAAQEIFALALTLADAETRAVLAPQVILAQLVPGEIDAEAIKNAVLPVINNIPPISPEQGDREGAAASLMIAISAMIPPDQLPMVLQEVFSAASESAPSMVPAMAAGAVIGSGVNAGAAAEAIAGTVSSDPALLTSVNNAMENPQQFVSPELNQAFTDNPPPSIAPPTDLIPTGGGDEGSNVINDPAPTITTPSTTETLPPDPAPLYPGQAG